MADTMASITVNIMANMVKKVKSEEYLYGAEFRGGGGRETFLLGGFWLRSCVIR